MTDWEDFMNSDGFYDMIMNQIEDCEYCGDGIPKDQMAEHVAWCKPMIEGDEE